MKLKVLQNCGLIENLERSGSTVEFNTLLFSPMTGKMERVTISCPLSGEHLLTEAAVFVGEDTQEFLEVDLPSLFEGFEASVGAVGNFRDIFADHPTDDLSSYLEKAAKSFLGGGPPDFDVEDLRFKFLKKCSESFQLMWDKQRSDQPQQN